jgi:sugar fermentation stimulation protein A
MEARRGRLEKAMRRTTKHKPEKETEGTPYLFTKPLVEGLIKSRPNRFIMLVEKGSTSVRCHCPSTGRIGDIAFKDIPCLLSESETEGRKTGCTVEAISLDPVGRREKSWIGINQNMANRYLEHFILTSQLRGMLGEERELRREVRLGGSRIDFAVGGTYVEVKTPLIQMPRSEDVPHREYAPMNSFDRLIRHFNELARGIRGGNRAILLLCYLYDAEPFRPPPLDGTNAEIEEAAADAEKAGVENWQINLRVDPRGVSLIRYFRLHLFR